MTHANSSDSPDAKLGLVSRLGAFALIVAIVALIAGAVIMFGVKLGLWEPLQGFVLYRTYFNPIAYTVTALALVALVVHLIRRDRTPLVLSVVALVIGAGMLVPQVMAALDPPVRAPPIHDITTDTGSPPQFLVLDDTRPGARNSLDYGGAETAESQKSAFPDIAPIQTDLSGQEAYQRALKVAGDMGWKTVDAQDDALRFEATAHTPVFHFADDVVVVVSPAPTGSRVDIRSVSRVGRGDRGVNAARVRAFLDAFGA
ncbi:DUF1499 domain-containing protein [Poseidonocella pacifica]|nr:DUF1499 domain-containing protein [Poseidonocella pacifica]